MSTHVGPSIIENGLVLSLDAANPKSFRGEPTTNELVQVTWGGDGGPTVATVTDESLKYKGYFTQSVIGGTSNNCYLNGADLSASRTSTVWTFSCYLRREDKLPITSMNVYMYYPSSDGSTAATIENVGDGWYRLSRTRTGADSYISLAGFTGLVSGVKYYLSGAQLEKKSYPTAYVTTNTTRGTTVETGGGWADLSGNGNHGELFGSVTYKSINDGVIEFPGTVGSYINITSPNLSSSDNTVMGASRYVSSGYGGRIISGGANNWLLGHHGTNSHGEYYANGWVNNASNTGGEVWRIYTGTGNISGDVWSVYENDQLLASNANGANGPNGFSLGRYYAGTEYCNAYLGFLLVYNRVLTESEIKQNFNALRGRYGI